MIAFSNGLEVHDTRTTKGRGVYAARSFEANEVVETCPVILLKGPFEKLPDELQNITFDWGYLSRTPQAQAIALGFGSLYNCANPSNVRYHALNDALTIVFTAARSIAVGEELTINYSSPGGGNTSDEDGWLTARGIKLLGAGG